MLTKSDRELNRERLNRFKTDPEFDAFVLDYYPEIKSKFSSGMDRVTKANLLVESIDPNELRGRLLSIDSNISSISLGVKNTYEISLSTENEAEFHTTSKAEIHCWDNNTSKQWDGEWTDPDEFRYAFKLMLRREGQRVDAELSPHFVTDENRNRLIHTVPVDNPFPILTRVVGNCAVTIRHQLAFSTESQNEGIAQVWMATSNGPYPPRQRGLALAEELANKPANTSKVRLIHALDFWTSKGWMLGIVH